MYFSRRSHGTRLLPRAPRRLFALLLCVTLFALTGCTGDKSGAYNRAIASFAAGEYAEAAIAFDKLGDYQQALTYAAYSHGLTYYEQGDYAAAETYFEQSKDFMYGAQRYTYCHASVLEDAGTFAEAAEAFATLGDFEDSALRAAYCRGHSAEETQDYETALFAYADASGYRDADSLLSNLQTQVYDHAKELKTAGSYEEALNWFALLGDYFDSQAQARDCKNYYRDQLYAQAETYENSGDLQQAYDLFSSLSGYRDAQARADEVAIKLGLDVDTVE